MALREKIRNIIQAFFFKKASTHPMIDIVEVRTKEIRLTSVLTETDIVIRNSFFLPITILSIHTELLNRDGLKVGRMQYVHPKKIRGNSEEKLTTVSEISIITSVFQALSTLLLQHIVMQSVGTARVKFLWWTFDVPVDDFFEIHPSKLKIVKDETPEEKILRKQRETEWKEKSKKEREVKREARAAMKEEYLKERYRENYIPKEERRKKTPEPETMYEVAETVEEAEKAEIVLNDETVQHMSDEIKNAGDQEAH